MSDRLRERVAELESGFAELESRIDAIEDAIDVTPDPGPETPEEFLMREFNIDHHDAAVLRRLIAAGEPGTLKSRREMFRYYRTETDIVNERTMELRLKSLVWSDAPVERSGQNFAFTGEIDPRYYELVEIHERREERGAIEERLEELERERGRR